MIEKNIRLEPHQSKDLLVGRRSDNKRPKYQPPGYGSSSARDSGSRGSPSGGGGGGSPHRDPPPAPAPARVSPMQSMAMTGNTSLAGKTQSEAQATVDRDNAMRDLGTSLHGGPTVKEALITGELKKQKIAEDLKNKLDTDFLSEDAKVKAPTTLKPKTEKYITRNPFTDEPIINERVKKYYTPTYNPKTDPNALLDRGSGILGTLGKIAFTGLTAGAGAGLLGKELATVAKVANFKKNYDRIQKSALGKKIGLKEFGNVNFSPKNIKDFIKTGGSKFDRLNPNEMKSVRTVKPTVDRDGNEANRKKTLAETITQGAGLKEGQKLLGLNDKQIQQVYQGRDLLKKTIESGMYQDRRLNMNEIKMLQGHMMKMENLIQAIEKAQAPVNVANGGLIDRPFMGRSRDI